jgi:hypothetical protein
MKIDWGKRSTRRKPARVPLCPPQIPHDLTCSRTRAAAVESQRLTARAMARPSGGTKLNHKISNEIRTEYPAVQVQSLTATPM